MRVRVKICGLTSREGVNAAIDCGADAIGFVFSPSPRQVSAEQATRLAVGIPPFVTVVAVFRQPSMALVSDVLHRFHPPVIQTEVTEELTTLAGDRAALLPVIHDSEDIVAAVESTFALDRQTVLLEAPGQGGRGMAPDWAHAERIARLTPLIVAGGLTPENVGDAIARIRPHAVDVSSGVECAPGHKDPIRIRAFMESVRAAGLEEPIG